MVILGPPLPQLTTERMRSCSSVWCVGLYCRWMSSVSKQGARLFECSPAAAHKGCIRPPHGSLTSTKTTLRHRTARALRCPLGRYSRQCSHHLPFSSPPPPSLPPSPPLFPACLREDRALAAHGVQNRFARFQVQASSDRPGFHMVHSLKNRSTLAKPNLQTDLQGP